MASFLVLLMGGLALARSDVDLMRIKSDTPEMRLRLGQCLLKGSLTLAECAAQARAGLEDNVTTVKSNQPPSAVDGAKEGTDDVGAEPETLFQKVSKVLYEDTGDISSLLVGFALYAIIRKLFLRVRMSVKSPKAAKPGMEKKCKEHLFTSSFSETKSSPRVVAKEASAQQQPALSRVVADAPWRLPAGQQWRAPKSRAASEPYPGPEQWRAPRSRAASGRLLFSSAAAEPRSSLVVSDEGARPAQAAPTPTPYPQAAPTPTPYPQAAPTPTPYPEYSGHFSHSAFGPHPVKMTVRLQSATVGQWVVFDSSMDITVKYTAQGILFSDGQTELDGTFQWGGHVKGEVVHDGVRDGSFVLNRVIPYRHQKHEDEKSKLEEDEKSPDDKWALLRRRNSDGKDPADSRSRSKTANSHHKPQVTPAPRHGPVYGEVKCKSPTKGFGFIECRTIREQFEKDAYMTAGCAVKFEVGDKVVFDYCVKWADGTPAVFALCVSALSP